MPVLVNQWISSFDNPKGDEFMTQRKKPNKKQRLAKRKEQADLYNEAFLHGYKVGLLEGHKQAQGGLFCTLELMKTKTR